LSTGFYDTNVTVETNSFMRSNFSSIKLSGSIAGSNPMSDMFIGGPATVIDLSESTITGLSEKAFYYISNLETVKLPSTLTSMTVLAI